MIAVFTVSAENQGHPNYDAFIYARRLSMIPLFFIAMPFNEILTRVFGILWIFGR